MSDIPNPYPNPVAKGYADMSVEELRCELNRLDEVVVKQDITLLKLKGTIHAVIADLSMVLVAHMKGDTKGVTSLLDTLCKIRVTVAAPGSMEVH